MCPELPTEEVLLNEVPSEQYDVMSDLVITLGVLNSESFCERGLSCVKLVVSDLHVSLKVEEIHMFVILRMNHEFMEYMRTSYPDTPLSEFKTADTYVSVHGGVDTIDDDEDHE